MRLAPALLLAAALALPALAPAARAESLTGPEREAFRAEVRAYLLEHPEVLMEAISVLDQRQAEREGARDREMLARNHARIFADPASWQGGNPEGDVTLVEFMDYRCGYCRRANPEVEELVASDGNIRFVIKEFPILGPQSELSSRFAIAVRRLAGDAAYKKAHDALITLRGEAVPETLDRIAADLGLDPAAVRAGMDAPEVTAVIEANRALAAEMGINGTPTFVLGDIMLRGYVPLEQMRQLVAEVRADG